jgi:hypothetical protein
MHGRMTAMAIPVTCTITTAMSTQHSIITENEA